MAADNRFRRKPLLPKGEKDGPTCKPMEYTKRIRPKFLAKWLTCGSMDTPSEEKMIPTNNIHVMPSEKFLMRRCSPAQSPRLTTNVSSTIDCVTDGVRNRFSIKDMLFFLLIHYLAAKVVHFLQSCKYLV